MVVFLILSTVQRTKDNTAMNDVTAFLITFFMITVLTGFVFALLSIRDGHSTKKAFAFIVNVVLFLFLGFYVLQNLVAI
ncbi:hypothetical protein BST97_07935 [Nonlabens spongiae]|uniref:Uncharacterized protein n=2 Tax=Nonlabens spongiae TaxID=331648 RepID=A0A1W6MK39_9FLAO|nr:hypothetical protein BST97_07935 [Nonlabens spongiae]